MNLYAVRGANGKLSTVYIMRDETTCQGGKDVGVSLDAVHDAAATACSGRAKALLGEHNIAGHWCAWFIPCCDLSHNSRLMPAHLLTKRTPCWGSLQVVPFQNL